MGLALALLAMTVIALALLLTPLVWRRRAAPGRDSYNLAVYRDQLAEIDRDVARGVLDPTEADAAKAEIGRRMLALAPAAPIAAPSSAPFAAAIGVLVALPLAAWLVYWDVGTPELPDAPHAAVAAEHLDIAAALKQLNQHLAEHPDDLKGWLLLARSQLDLHHFPEAAEAYRHAADLSGQKPAIVGDWGEAQVLAADGSVTPAAAAAFKTALADPDSAPRSRYYLALADEQAGDTKKALQEWVDLEAAAPPNAPYLPLLKKRIADAAKTLDLDPATLTTSAGAPRKAANQPSR